MLVVRIGILDAAFEQNALRNIEVGPSGSKLCDGRAQERREDTFKDWHEGSIERGAWSRQARARRTIQAARRQARRRPVATGALQGDSCRWEESLCLPA